jgi:hypothetical protein
MNRKEAIVEGDKYASKSFTGTAFSLNNQRANFSSKNLFVMKSTGSSQSLQSMIQLSPTQCHFAHLCLSLLLLNNE